MTFVISAVLAVSTAYCDTGTMADGSYTRPSSVASNSYPLGTHLRIWPSPTGQRRFVVRDRIGWGSELDFWLSSCSAARAWGRRPVHIRREGTSGRTAGVFVPSRSRRGPDARRRTAVGVQRLRGHA